MYELKFYNEKKIIIIAIYFWQNKKHFGIYNIIPHKLIQLAR